MASQDQISQFSQMIPPSQPDRSLSRPKTQPGRMAHFFNANVSRTSSPCYGCPATGVYPRYGTHLNIRLVSNPTTPDHNHLCLPCSMPYAFPPQLPLHPPPPPPSCPSTPHRFCTTRPKSPSGLTRPQTTSPVNRGYTIRPCEIPPIDTWKPASEFHDAAKVNGLDFAATIRSSKFTSYKDIEGMDPLQVPLWKFLYRGLHNRWLYDALHTAGKPMSSRSTTYGIRCRARQPTSVPQH